MVVKIGQSLVAPADNGFIGGQFLQLPVLAQVIGKALVEAGNIGFAGRAVLAGHGQTCVHAGDEGAIGCFVLEKNLGRDAVGWLNIKLSAPAASSSATMEVLMTNFISNKV